MHGRDRNPTKIRLGFDRIHCQNLTTIRLANNSFNLISEFLNKLILIALISLMNNKNIEIVFKNVRFIIVV